MVAAVEVSATPELEAIAPSIDAVLRHFQDRLNSLSPDEVVAVLEGAARALDEISEPVPPAVTALMAGRTWTAAERMAARFDVLARSFARRRELLADSLTSSQVAQLLGTSRQTPHDRVESGTLLAVMDRGALRFPIWQFDPDGEGGVVAGLPAVLRALEVSPMAKVSWLTRPNYMLDGETPLACLKSGDVERVVGLARAVGFN
jgi:hypothetical protein